MNNILIVAALLLACAAPATAQKTQKTEKPARPAATDNYDELFARYLDAARHQTMTVAPTSAGWMNSLMSDSRARHVNDLLTVRVVESISASGTADSSLDKQSSASAGVSSLFGVEKKLPSVIDPSNLASAKASSGFKGAGTTNRASDLTAVITARVSEVLPNGDLVIEGVREIEINGDRQVVVLTGVVRAVDIAPDNSVRSTSLGQLRVRYFGRGLMKDSLSPGWLIRVLNKVF
ncbi:MAG TPA: flagellar basal body L-ring protein FlgH [Vicinamibacterales bacterium]|nr:flagellar basal body L-ring protein FlgH [Vicinamibacterales bacterium]